MRMEDMDWGLMAEMLPAEAADGLGVPEFPARGWA